LGLSEKGDLIKKPPEKSRLHQPDSPNSDHALRIAIIISRRRGKENKKVEGDMATQRNNGLREDKKIRTWGGVKTKKNGG